MIAIFVSGICLATFAASGYFFLRFWKGSRDSFFLYFSIACWLLAIERLALLFFGEAALPIRSELTEASSWVYLMRLGAFAFILIAIIHQNRSGFKGRKD